MRNGSNRSMAGLRVAGSAEGWVGKSRERPKSKESIERHERADRYFGANEVLRWYNPCRGNWTGDSTQTKEKEVDALKKVSGRLHIESLWAYI